MENGPLITVVETAPYLAAASGLMSEAERSVIVDWIAANPRSGAVMPETGGLRKVRIPLAGRGKRGGGRMITFFHDEGMPVFLLAAYAKNAQSDLTPSQRKAAKAVTDAIKAQYGR